MRPLGRCLTKKMMLVVKMEFEDTTAHVGGVSIPAILFSPLLIGMSLMNKRNFLKAAAAGSLLMHFPLAHSQPLVNVPTNIFLSLSTINGESVDPAHLNGIDIDTYSFGGTHNDLSKVAFSTMDVTAIMDAAYPLILTSLAKGTHLASAVLSLCQSTAPYTEYAKVTLSDVIITSVQVIGATTDAKPLVKYSIDYAKIEQSTWALTAQGTKGVESRMGWNIVANTTA